MLIIALLILGIVLHNYLNTGKSWNQKERDKAKDRGEDVDSTSDTEVWK